MGDIYLSEDAMDLVDFLVNVSEEELAIEASVSRIQQFKDDVDRSDYTYGPRSIAVLKLWNSYRTAWKAVRNDYKRADLRNNIDDQKKALIEERGLILETIKAVDTIPENALNNIAFMVGLTALTIGLSGMVLSIPSSALVVEAGKDAFMAAGGSAGSYALHTAANGALGIASTVANATMALKMIGLTVKYSDPTHSLLRSQKATGVMSKQLLVLRLNRALAQTDKKIQYVMTKQLLVTNQYALEAMEKYSDQYLENFVKQTQNMNSQMNERAKQFANEATFLKDKKKNDKNDKNNQNNNNNNNKGKNNKKNQDLSKNIDTLIKSIT